MRTRSLLCLFFLVLFQPVTLLAAGGAIHGVVKSGDKPLVGATVRLLELDRIAHTDAKGEFFFPNVGNGTYQVYARMIGYTSVVHSVEVNNATSEISFSLKESAIQGEVVVVSASPDARGSQEDYQSVDSRTHTDLHQSSGQSFAEQISDLPGVDVRYNGSAPARPMLRGLSDNEVLVLENGLRTADVSTFDPAHATPISPESIAEIDIVRGPSSVLFGPNAIGGLVNVITNTVPNVTADGLTGRASITGNTLSNLYSGYFNTVYSTGSHAFSLSAGGSHSDAIRIPSGTYTDPGSGNSYTLDTIPQSFNRSSEEAIGYSYQSDFGTIGAGIRHYQANYGIPGDPTDMVYMAPSISRIAQEKYVLELHGLFDIGGSFLKQIRLNSNIVDYLHSEHPTEQDSTGAVSEFEQNNFHSNGYNTTLQFVQQRMNNWEGTIGLFANFNNLELGGPQPLGPNSLTTDLAGYVFEEYIASEQTRLQGALRFDYDKIQTKPASNSAVDAFRTSDTSRTANAVTGSLGLVKKLGDGLTMSLGIARSFRAPTVQELFGQGPDDASASSIVGNPSIGPETGLGLDGSLKGTFDGFSFAFSPYINFISNYIYSYETGVVDSLSDPQYPYRYFAQTDARLFGFELSSTVQLVEHFSVSANVGYVNAAATRDSVQPLPFTPPMKGLVRFDYRDDMWSAMLEWRLTAKQDRVGIGETVTAGYGLVNLGVGLRLLTGSAVHQIAIHCDNLLDQRYFDHLSVFHDFLPGPGRAVRLTYDLLF